VLFGVYTCIVMLHPTMSASQHQWQDNIVRAEKYIYNERDTVKNIIIGSSLSLRLIPDSLPQFYNMAFAGQGIFDGLKILNHQKNPPKNVFIETNLVFREESKEFTSGLFSFLGYNIKKYCVSLRTDKEPLVFIYPLVQSVIHSKRDIIGYAQPKSIKEDSSERELTKNLLQIQVTNYSKLPDTSLANKQFSILTDEVTLLKSKGVKVIFFEMPINPLLVQSPLEKLIRTKFYMYFPKSENNYIDIPDCTNYVTGDGLHLNPDEAAIYTSYFKENTKKYLK